MAMQCKSRAVRTAARRRRTAVLCEEHQRWRKAPHVSRAGGGGMHMHRLPLALQPPSGWPTSSSDHGASRSKRAHRATRGRAAEWQRLGSTAAPSSKIGAAKPRRLYHLHLRAASSSTGAHARRLSARKVKHKAIAIATSSFIVDFEPHRCSSEHRVDGARRVTCAPRL